MNIRRGVRILIGLLAVFLLPVVSSSTALAAAPTEVQTFPVLKGADHQAHGSKRYSVNLRPAGSTGSYNYAYVYRSDNDIVDNPGRCVNPDGGCGRDNGRERNRRLMSAANHWASFGYDNGPVEVVINAYWGEPTDFKIFPDDAPIEDKRLVGNELRLTLNQPTDEDWSRQFYVQFEGRNYDDHPLFVFADPTFDGCPAGPVADGETFRANGDDVTIGRPGEAITLDWDDADDLPNNAAICIPGGAYVKGSLGAGRVSGVRIFGRGILSGIDRAHSTLPRWNGQLIRIGGGSSGIEVSGITLTDGPRAMLESYGQTAVDNVKVMGWHVNTDGITVGRNSTVRDVFLKVNDDAMKLTYSNLLMERALVWQQPAGSVLQMGWNNQQEESNSVVDKLRLLSVDLNTDIGDQNGAILSMRNTMGGTVSGFRVSDVVAYDNPYQILSLRLNDQLVYRDDDRSRQQCRSAELRRNVSCDVLDGNGVVQVIVLQDVTTPRQVVASVIDENGDAYRGDRHQGDLAYLNEDDQIRNIQFRNVRIGDKKLVHWNSRNPDHVPVSEHLIVSPPGRVPIGNVAGVLAY